MLLAWLLAVSAASTIPWKSLGPQAAADVVANMTVIAETSVHENAVIGLRAIQYTLSQNRALNVRVHELETQNAELHRHLSELERRLVLIGEMLDFREQVRAPDEPTLMVGAVGGNSAR